MATYRAEAYATSVELQNAKKHLELAENALQRNETLISQLKEQVEQLKKAVLQSSAMILHPCRAVDNKDEQLAALTAENDFLKEKVVQLGNSVEGFWPRSKPKEVYTAWDPASDCIDALRYYLADGRQVRTAREIPGLKFPMTVRLHTGNVNRWTISQDGKVVASSGGSPEPAEPKPKSTWTFNPMGHGYTLATPQMPTGEPGCPVAWATINIIPDKEPEQPKPAAEKPKNPFASYVAPKKEQKYRELGEGDVFQRGDFWTYKSRFNDEAGRWEMTEQDATRYWAIPDVWHGKPVQYRYDCVYIRPITEKDAE